MLIILVNHSAQTVLRRRICFGKSKLDDKHDPDLEKASRQQSQEEEHHGGENSNQQKGGTLESEGGGMKSDNRIPLGQFAIEEGPNNNGLRDEVAVNDIPDNDEVADNGLEDEVAVNDIPEMEEEVVVHDDEAQIFMVLKHQNFIMLRAFVLKSI